MTRIAVVGDFSESVIAHVAINASLAHLGAAAEGRTSHTWIPTPDAESVSFDRFDGVWCTPASPYASELGALRAIRFARQSGTPFLGTCGGYQYAVLEYARHVLKLAEADNTEVNPDTPVPLITGLSCSLVEVRDDVRLQDDCQVAGLIGRTAIDAAYHCRYGVNRDYLPLFSEGPLVFSGHDKDGDPRVFEHRLHPFFIGTAFQPERDALDGPPHALVSAFVSACEIHHANREETSHSTA